MGIRLYQHQLDALKKLSSGKVLNGGVGSGKSLTALGYFFKLNGGSFDEDGTGPSEGYVPMDCEPMDLYIITTAMKRDKKEWNLELARFLMAEGDKEKNESIYHHKVVIDSWNNIAKYKDIKNAFFIFDETKVRSWGEWSKSFVKIGLNNQWIMLTATPADKWEDYMAIFLANGYYKNATEFRTSHLRFNPHVPYPSVMSYINTGKLIRLRNNVLVDMEMNRHTKRHDEYLVCEYDKTLYMDIVKNRWNFDENRPIENASEYCQQLRKVVNGSEDKTVRLLELFESHPKMIIFYNYNYELEDLRSMFEFMSYDDNITDFVAAEWNGHVHQALPTTDSWVYFVQYNAGCEGWNAITTDTIVFYSDNYSFSMMEQAKGRIDRLNTPFIDLYYYHLLTNSPIDMSIQKALKAKKKFNEGKFAKF